MKIGVTQNHRRQHDSEHLRGVANVDMEAGDDPAEAHAEQPYQKHVDRQKQDHRTQMAGDDQHRAHGQHQRDQVIQQRRQEDGHRHHFGREHRLRDQIRVIEQRRRGALNRLLKQQPRQKSAEQKQRIVLRETPSGRGIRRQIWNTNVQLSNRTSGCTTPHNQPAAEPTNRCWKSRRTS